MDETTGGPLAVWLVGAGVVGREIARAHLRAGCDLRIADSDPAAIRAAVAELTRDGCLGRAVDAGRLGDALAATWVQPPADAPLAAEAPLAATDSPGTVDRPPNTAQGQTILIESIAERLEVKQAFFRSAEEWFGEKTAFFTNTSSLRVGTIATGLRRPQRLAGMHFFMPVTLRPGVELVAAAGTAAETLEVGRRHIRRLGRQPIIARDEPGFIVNRMLAPYLNQAMLLFSEGVGGETLEAAAEEYGMPMSPLELIDWIGTRTAFDAGRAFWQAFPRRLDPAPLLAAMLKRQRLGRASGGGFYDYENGARSDSVSPLAAELAGRYRRTGFAPAARDVPALMAIPMWIEAMLLLRDGVAEDWETIEQAMAAGLGYTRRGRWGEFVDTIGPRRVLELSQTWRGLDRAVDVSAIEGLTETLRRGLPTGVKTTSAASTRSGASTKNG